STHGATAAGRMRSSWASCATSGNRRDLLLRQRGPVRLLVQLAVARVVLHHALHVRPRLVEFQILNEEVLVVTRRRRRPRYDAGPAVIRCERSIRIAVEFTELLAKVVRPELNAYIRAIQIVRTEILDTEVLSDRLPGRRHNLRQSKSARARSRVGVVVALLPHQ